MIKVAFRFDDPSITSDHSLEKNIIDICQRYSVKINFSVIPYKEIKGELQALTKQKAAHLISAEKNDWIEISQHGYAHINHSQDSIPSEFSEESSKKQYNKITQGKSILDQLFLDQPRGFVPPWNTFNKATASAISDTNFLFISAGWEIPYLTKFLVPILPRTCQITSLADCIKQTERFSSLDPIIIAVMHHYDFIESNKKGTLSLTEFESFIKNLSTQKNILITSLNELAKTQSVSDSVNAVFLHSKVAKLHWRLKKYAPNSCLINCSDFKLYTTIAKNILRIPKL